jgi:hypothetical protein
MARIPAALVALCLLALAAGCSGNAAHDDDAAPPGPMGIQGSY